jgi:hypothetical protein
VPNRVYDDIDVLSMYGAFYLILVPLSVFMVIFDELVKEKVDHLRQGMELLGTQNLAYWSSWLLSATVLNVATNLEMCLLGKYYYEFSVFARSPLPVMFFLLFITTQAYIVLACFFATLVKTKTQAFSVNFSLVLVSMVTNIIISEPSTLKKIFFNLDNSLAFKVAARLFYLNPCFEFAKMFADVTSVACAFFSPETFTWFASTREFEYSDLFREQTGIFLTKDRYHVVSFYDTTFDLLLLMLFYGLLAWYFDSTLSSNRGVPLPKDFLFRPSFWFSSLRNVT